MQIIAEALSKRYGNGFAALTQIQLSIGKGMFGLLGPNGAGKTTLMRIICTLLPASSGRLSVLGLDAARSAQQIRSRLGYLPQEFSAYPSLTGRQFLDYVAGLKGLRGNSRRTAVADALDVTNLAQVAGRQVRTYSGGMKRRLGIAQALLGTPDLIVVDEPTAGLDPEERVRFRNLLADLSADRIVLMSTHVAADVESTCTHVAVLDHGRVQFQGTPQTLAARGCGHVWELSLDTASYERIKGNVQVVSTRRTDTGVTLRALARENPLGAGMPAAPTLEEGYLALMEEVLA